jgi:Mg-chelatase subunit ChlD
MISTWVQVGLGLVPAMLLFLLLSIFSKRYRTRNICLTIVTFLLICGFVIPGLIPAANRGRISKTEVLKLIYAIADEESPETAESLLSQLRADYSEEYALAAARISAQKGDCRAAKALYLKAGYDENQGEYSAVLSLCEADDLYYGLSDASGAAEAHELRTERQKNLTAVLENAFEKETPSGDDNFYKKFAKSIVYADQSHKAYLRGDDFDMDEAEMRLRRLNSLLEENPEFLGVTGVRIARLKLQILCGEYRQLAESVGEESDYNELMIASELYLNDYLKQSYFRDEFSSENLPLYEALYQKLSDIYSDRYQDKPREDRNDAKALLNALKATIKKPALAKMRQGLLGYAQTPYAIDASKVYMQLAKIEHYLGNEPKVSEYIDRSIDTVGNCEDNDYTLPMYKLVEIIADKDDPERLKSVAGYVDQVLDNNMTVKLADTLPSGGPAETEEAGSLSGEFASQVQTYVNQKRMSVNIVSVDTTNFEKDNTVRATVTISNNLYTDVEELKAAMSVQDCGIDINDFTIEKVDYTGANILLCVDVSGSMAYYGKIGELKEAIKLFVSEKAPVENIALVTFSHYITGEYPFGTTADQIALAADSIKANGMTNMYDALVHSLGKFAKIPGEINAIILMSDGLDSYPADIASIEEYIGGPAKEKGVTIYAIGFGGDADSSYLNTFAAVTGGAYLYADEPSADSGTNQLGEFFSGLRAQVLNQYEVTFKAVDTLSYVRELQIAVGEGLDRDKVTYYRGGGADSLTEPGIDEESPLYMEDKAINGFRPCLLYKNGTTLNATLLGEGFTAEDNISISVRGTDTGVEWDLGTAFIDSNSLSVTIPAGIGDDVYDAYISINGKTAVLPKGLSVFTQGTEKITDFGQYRFISYTRQNRGDTTILSGFVTMNGWLSFNGDITLTGDLDGGRITLTDLSGSVVRYDGINSEGLASILGEKGIPVRLPPLGVINLYDDSEYEKQFADVCVEAFPLNALDLGGFFGFDDIDARLYPNRASFEAKSLTASLPFATKILNEKADIFVVETEAGVTVSSKKIGCKVDAELHPNKSFKGEFFKGGLGNMPIYVSPWDMKVHIDTIANDYEFDFAIKLPFIDNKDDEDDEMRLRLKWDNPDSGDRVRNHSNGLVPTEINVYIPGKIKSAVAGIPITYDSFFFGIEDIDTSKPITKWTLVGGMDVSAVKVSEIPGLAGMKEWIGDVSVLKLDGAKLSLKLGEFFIMAETDVKLFEELDMGNLTLEIGKFPYSCALLGMDNEPVSGFMFRGRLGPDWKFGKSSIKAQVEGELDIMNRFIGIQGKADFDIHFEAWVVSIGTKLSGDLVIGVVITPRGSAFVIRSNPKLPLIGEITWPKNMAGKV